MSRLLAGDGYVASKERDGSTPLGMTNTLQASRLSIPPTVISTKRSAWRDLSMGNAISNQWEMHTIIRNFSLFYLEVNL